MLILSFLKKYWIYVVAVAAIAALVVVLSIFTDYNLLGWTSKTEVSLSETSISVAEINEIGELVTAEYYGEVVKSYQEAVRDQASNNLEQAYDDIKKSWEATRKEHAGKNIRRQVRRFRRKDISDSHAYNLFKEITQLDDREFLEYIEKTPYADMQREYQDRITTLLREENNQNDRNALELVYLARGWVKAGFDLTDLSEVEYRGDTILLYGLEPKILDVDINPWYIPKLGIKGFEVIKERNAKGISFDELALVKRACKERLQEDAMERRMLEYALTNGEASLASFFGLFNQGEAGEGDEPIVRVVLPRFYFERQQILLDKRIDSEEVIQLKQLVASDTALDRAYFDDMETQAKALNRFIIDLTGETINVDNDSTWDDFVLSRYYNGYEEGE